MAIRTRFSRVPRFILIAAVISLTLAPNTRGQTGRPRDVPRAADQTEPGSNPTKTPQSFAGQTPTPSEAADIGGVYTGHYVCGQGYTPLKLTITPQPDGTLAAVFAFQPPGGAPGGRRGVEETAYAMKGRYTAASGQFQLNPDRWLTIAPIGYMMVGVTGTYDSHTDTLQARITAPGCTSVEVKRDEAQSAQLKSQVAVTSQQMQNLPAGAIAAGRFPEACLAIKSWTSRVEKEYPDVDMDHTVLDAVYPRLMNLFEDQYFAQFFGKPYDELSPQERTRIGTQTMRQCFTNTQYRSSFTWQKQMERPFILLAGSFSQAQVMGGVLERRRLREEFRQAVDQIKALPPASDSWEKALGFESRAKTFNVLWPSEYKGFDGAVSDAKRRAAAPVLEARLQPLLASARGFEGLEALERFPSQQAALFASLDAGATARYRQQIAAKTDALRGDLLAEERSRMQALPSGLAGLERGAAWYQEFQARFNLRGDRATQDLSRTFLERRNQLLAAAQPELAKLIQQAKTPEEVSSVLRKYVPLPTDQQSPMVAKLEQTAKTRSDALGQTAKIRSDAQERAAVLGGGSTASQQASTTASSPNAAKREPTEGEMYDAVKAVMDSYNSNMKETDAACKSGAGRNDPLLGIQCLVMAGASGGRLGIQAKITSFRKIGCEKANGKPGYICDYRSSMSTSGLTVPDSMRSMMAAGDVGQKRFVWNGDRWLALDAEETVRVIR